jgi:hypothetical protein
MNNTEYYKHECLLQFNYLVVTSSKEPNRGQNVSVRKLDLLDSPRSSTHTHTEKEQGKKKKEKQKDEEQDAK